MAGFTFFEPGLFGKWSQLLKEVAPATATTSLPFNPGTAGFYYKFFEGLPGLGSQVKLSSQSLNLAMAAAGAGAQVGIFLPFSRDNELEADSLGVDYMQSAGYDVKQAIKLWEKMDAAGGPRQSEWMSTHPNPGTRIEQLKKHINDKGYAKV